MKLILVFLLAVITTACASTKPLTECPPCQPKIIEKPVVLKCEPPEVPQAELETIKREDPYEERLRKLIKNYGILKEENLLLRKALEVCK
ncbi:MAG: hypothetical protein QW228_06755 [Candidatus Aenigmatarchaeota archaeon]